MRRRSLLAALAATTAGSATTAGCLDALSTADATKRDATSTASEDATGPKEATTTSCTVDDSFPVVGVEVPDDPTPGAARSLAEFVEEAYARDRADAEGWNVSGVEYVHSESLDDDARSGTYAYAEVSIDAAESAERSGDAETTVLASLDYDGWYRVTATRVERAPAYDDGSPPEYGYGWTTIACD
jgi:hypothetical protein